MRHGRDTGRMVWLAILIAFGIGPRIARSQAPAPPPAVAEDQIKFDQKLGEQVPLDLTFRNSVGKSVRLDEYLGEKPAVLVMAYYECPMLCSLVLNGMVNGLKGVPFTPGEDYDVIVVSIDPREEPDLAYENKKGYVHDFGRPETADGWHFMVGAEPSIKRLAEAVGFGYAYDPKSNQYAHPAGIILLTADGKVSRYFFGLDYDSSDLRLGLVEASDNKIGSAVDQILLRCLQYDPSTGRYTLAVFNVLRGLAILTVAALVALVWGLIRREKRKAALAAPAEASQQSTDR